MRKKRILKNILRETYVVNGKVDEDAVNAALYFLSVLDTWDALSAKVGDPDALDVIVMMILNGEANMTVPLIDDLSKSMTNIAVAQEFIQFISSIMSGEAANNQFIKRNRDFLIGPLMDSATTEVARRKLTGKAKEIADGNRWQVLVAISAKLLGAGPAIDFSLNLREALADGISSH